MWLNLVNLTSSQLLHVPPTRHHVSVNIITSREQSSKIKVFLQFMNHYLHKTLRWFPGGCRCPTWKCWFYNQWRLWRVIQGVWRLANAPVWNSCSAPCDNPSRQFHCSSTCGQCCWASSLRPWTPGSPTAAGGSWRSGPPEAGSRHAAGRTARPSADCLPSPAALRCDAAAAPGSPPAGGGGGDKHK